MVSKSSQHPRCYAPPQNWSDEEVLLSADESHHLIHVLRCNPGETVQVFDGRGREAKTELAGTTDSGSARLRLLQLLTPTLPCREIELVQAIPKGGRMETVLQKATELGVTSIQPVLTEHTVVKLSGKRRAKKEERWQKIVIGSAKQCLRSTLPQMQSLCSFSQYLSRQKQGTDMLICSLEEDAKPLATVIGDMASRQTKAIKILIGPEGDFNDTEYEAAKSAGAIPVSLGERVLRTDTASIYILSIIDYALTPADCNRTQ